MKSLDIRQYNIPAHLDIEREVQERKNGLLTFTVRVNGGNIVDLTVVEYVDARREYGAVATLVVEKLAVTYSRS